MKLRKLKLKLMTVAEVKEKVGMLVEAGKEKGAVYVAATDKMLLKYKYTAAVRNLSVNFYQQRLAPIVNPVLVKLLGNNAKSSGYLPVFNIKPVRAAAPVRSAPPPKAAPAPAPPVAEPEEEKEQVDEKEFKLFESQVL